MAKWLALGLLALGAAFVAAGCHLGRRDDFEAGNFLGVLLFMALGAGSICAAIVLAVAAALFVTP